MYQVECEERRLQRSFKQGGDDAAGLEVSVFFDEIIVVSEHLGVFIPLPVRRFHAKFSGRKLGGEDQQLPDLGINFCMKTARWILLL
jgi:hypothetical protein